MRESMAAILLALAATAVPAQAAPAPPSYRPAAPTALPDGRWDLLSVDQARHRVLIARGDSVTIVDMANGAVRSVGSIMRGHAAVAIEGTNLIAVTSGGDNSVRLIDADDGRQIASIPVGLNPDAALYDVRSRRLIVMNAKAGTVSVVDPRAAKVVRTIAVKPALELAVLIAPNLLAINDEDANEIELVDLKRGVALAPIALAGCDGPTGIAFDPADRLLLSACANGQAALVDTRARRLIGLLPIGKGADGALFDDHRRVFLVPGGQSATLSVLAVGRDRHVTALPAIPTAPGARTAALDQATGRVYLPTATFAPAVGNARPAAIAGTARLIVVEPYAPR
jgi:DNA-binding beta-propeller fold protein YncE